MTEIVLAPTKAAKSLFNFIDFDVLSQCLTILVNNSLNEAPNKREVIKVEVSSYPSKEEPWCCYMWKANAIHMHPFTHYKPDYVERRFISIFVHEFRHWMQNKMLRISFHKNYSGDGMEYYKCPLEKDTREYTKLVVNPILKMYKNLIELKDKANEFKKLNIKFN